MSMGAAELGGRLAAARGRAMLTQADLAAEIGIDRSVLAKMEKGTRRVTALELSMIAGAVGERIEWFLADAPAAIVSHRNLAEPGAPSPAIDRLVERAARNVEFVLGNDSQFDLPDLPVLERPTSAATADRLADQVRGLLGVGAGAPVHDVAGLAAQRLGILGFSLDMTHEAADAASILLRSGAVVLVNGSLQTGRRRMAFAHDLGHCVVADEYTVDWRIAGETSPDTSEALLDRFARALLLPDIALRETWPGLVESGGIRTAAVQTASQFRVDMSTLARRLADLGMIGAADAGQVRQSRAVRADFVELDLVPHDELLAPLIPRAYAAAVLRLYRSESVSAARALDLLMDTWAETDLPELPTLPETAIWQVV